MITCPACGSENIEGTDQCTQCQGNLMDIGVQDTPADELSDHLLHDSILALKPELKVQVTPEDSVAEVMKVMCDQHAGAVMVAYQGELVGIFTERDFLMKIADRYESLAHEPIRKFMTAGPEYMEAKDPIAFGLNRMTVKHYRHIPILEDGKPLALVRTRDVLDFIANHVPLEN